VTVNASQAPSLEIRFHGRVIEHLGIEMYHSPVAAIAELVSNAWDAEATAVNIQLPATLTDNAAIAVSDDGDGMTLAECQGRFLNVGYNRRGVDQDTHTKSGRPMMGRKGIGKFAGFGIADVVRIETISKATGERTVFELHAQKLLGKGDGNYVDTSPMEVEVLEYEGPDKERAAEHGTTLTLQGLTLKQAPSKSVFSRSMGRRFALLERAEGFAVTVNKEPLEPGADAALIEFDFPGDYPKDKLPAGVTIKDGWGVEVVAGETVRWRFSFYKEPISDDELAGVSVYSHGKLSQRPFQFLLSGGIGGQQGLPYLSGSVIADFIDEQRADLISTERQRINWEHEKAAPLLEWGQARIKSLLRIWQAKRAEAKVASMEARLATFSGRLEKLPKHEKQVVKRALQAIARISSLSSANFDTLADAMLHAWEGGRLKDLIHDMAEADELDSARLVDLLAESRVITALHAAERVKSQLNLILSLQERIANRQLENAVRDFIAKNPWLISPIWETFRVETGVNHLIKEAAGEAGLDSEDDWNARVDLTLSSGNHLLVLEFMRPDLTADWDHINRFQRYVLVLREKVDGNAGSKYSRVSGILVADKLAKKAGMAAQLRTLRSDDMDAMDWHTLLASAKAQWAEYFAILQARAPEDERMEALASASRPLVADQSSAPTDALSNRTGRTDQGGAKATPPMKPSKSGPRKNRRGRRK
jgi:hypothetical protein